MSAVRSTEIQVYGRAATGVVDANASVMISAIMTTDNGPVRAQFIVSAEEWRRVSRAGNKAAREGKKFKPWSLDEARLFLRELRPHLGLSELPNLDAALAALDAAIEESRT